MPALFGESRPESVQAFFTRTDPFKQDGSGERELFGDIQRRRGRIEYAGHERVAPSHILLAREIAAIGVENIARIEREKGNKGVFPPTTGYSIHSVFETLPTDDKELVRYSYAAVIFGVMVEAMYDMITAPHNQPNALFNPRGEMFFDRVGFTQKLNATLKPLNAPKIDAYKDLPVAMPSDKDPKTESEIVSPYQANDLRGYVEKTGLYDFLTPEHEFKLPESLRRFLQSVGFVRELIMMPSSGEANSKLSIRNLYHERAMLLAEHDDHMQAAERLLESMTSPREVIEGPTPLPTWMDVDINFDAPGEDGNDKD